MYSLFTGIVRCGVGSGDFVYWVGLPGTVALERFTSKTRLSIF